MAEKTSKILILGAGYSGVMTAVRMAGKTKNLGASITLVNASENFIERPRLHEKATGVALPQKSILRMVHGTGIRFVRGWAKEIALSKREVQVQGEAGELLLRYDYLVLALGSRVERSLIPGVDDHAYTLDPYGDLSTDPLREKLKTLGDQGARIIVVGGGATGIEAATQVKGMYPWFDVRLVSEGKVGAFKGSMIRQHILTALEEQSIPILENTRVIAVDETGLLLKSGRIPADLVLWAAGFTASGLAEKAGLQVNQQKQVLVDPYLRALSHPEIYAIGDAACPLEEPGAPWRMSLFTALVSGAQAADNITDALKGKAPRPLSYAWYGQAIVLGPADAVGFSTYPKDIPWRLVFRRWPAVWLRRFFIWYLGSALEIERRIPGFFFWNGKKRYAKGQSPGTQRIAGETRHPIKRQGV